MSDSDRPNIILITTDQQRYDTLGVTGNARIRSPNLDGLAECGTLFERAYIQNPCCIPSRACLQTGRYTHQHGVLHMERVIDLTPGLPEWELTFMERLQMAGYRTGATGKIHNDAPERLPLGASVRRQGCSRDPGGGIAPGSQAARDHLRLLAGGPALRRLR